MKVGVTSITLLDTETLFAHLVSGVQGDVAEVDSRHPLNRSAIPGGSIT